MEKFKNLILDNKTLILPIIGFVFGLYMQHLNNIQKIESIEAKQVVLERIVIENYKQLDQVKLDKQTFETYTQSVSDLKVSIMDIQKDIKLILSKGKY